MSLRLQIDVTSETPVYHQIVDGIRTVLVQKKIAAGDRLPTVRRLAIDLGIHFNTVSQAYRILEKEGWVTLARRRGAVVVDRNAPRQRKEVNSKFVTALRSLLAQASAEGVSQSLLMREISKFQKSLQPVNARGK